MREGERREGREGVGTGGKGKGGMGRVREVADGGESVAIGREGWTWIFGP